MTDKPRTCSNCASRSTGINTLSLDYCYCHDRQVKPDGTCAEWRGSLRDEPLNGPDMRLVENVAALDNGQGED